MINFDEDFFKANRQKLKRHTKSSLIILSANGLLQKTMDQSYPFSQDSNFWYLTGLNEPDLVLVIIGTDEFILIPEHYTSRESVTSFTDIDNFKKISGINEVLNHKEGWCKLRDLVKKSASIAYPMPSPVILKHYGIYPNPARRQLLDKLKRISRDLTLEDIRPILASQRMSKQAIEIEAIKKATDITLETLNEVLNKDRLAKYRDTTEIERDILAGFLSRGSSGHGFDPVIAGGANAALFHFADLGNKINKNELLYVDVGAKLGMYASDITRTVHIDEPTNRQKEVIEAVKQAQKEARSLIRPGIMLKEYEIQAEQIVGKQLINLGLINNLKRQSIRKYYPHLCSHSLGLDIHDATNWTTPVPENMVMTVEPGIYILEEGIGVRIEDIVLVNKNGNSLLS